MNMADTASVRPILTIESLRKEFPKHDGDEPLIAVNDVDLDVRAGETLGLVGESGSGKSTLARMIVGLEPPTSGRIGFGARDLGTLAPRGWRDVRRKIQMVFQDPSSSLNPRMTIGETLYRPLRIHSRKKRRDARGRVVELLAMVGLRAEHADRYPHELSGGQQQRVGIARALAPEPQIAVLDEPTSALDVSVQAQILMLIRRLQEELGLTIIFISHNLSVIQFLSHRVAVLYRGRLMELGETSSLMRAPLHPYTRHLLGTLPRFYGGLPPAPSATVASVEDSGCPFYARCPRRLDVCQGTFPPLAPAAPGHSVACFNPNKET